ncbi:cupin domain-containing protein [bacterium]
MNEFPEFMKNPTNQIPIESQYTEDVEGYVFRGADGSQMAFWTCFQDRESLEHSHEYDEYFIVVQGQYQMTINNKEILIQSGQEYFIPKGTPHSGKAKAGTRTIHCFGGQRVN